MTLRNLSLYLVLLLLLLAGPVLAAQPQTTDHADILKLSGEVKNSHGQGIDGVTLTFYIDLANGPAVETTRTGESGQYNLEKHFTSDSLSGASITMEARRLSYAPTARVSVPLTVASISATRSTLYLSNADLVMRRIASPAMWISAAVLMLIYLMIGFELVHRALAAMLGAALVLAVTYLIGPFFPEFRILSFEAAARAIDFNVLLLLFAMMVIVAVSEKSGMFQWLAHFCFQLSGGRAAILACALMALTAVTSAFLDNVTTMLLIIPVTLEIAAVININPLSLLIPEVFASNIGGAATLIGDPPNIMIGSYAGLTFTDFIVNLAVPALVSLGVAMIYFLIWYRKDFAGAARQDKDHRARTIDSGSHIKDRRLLIWSLLCLAGTIAMFLLHGTLGMEPSIAALIGATTLLLASRVDIIEILEKKIEWPTLIFFTSLFIVVAAAEQSGLIHFVADWVKTLSGASTTRAILLILWISAVASALIDNIPFVATMLPVVGYLSSTLAGGSSGILWWALALGACLGGNGTMIGASANMVTVGLAEKAGHKISFAAYARMCFAPMVLSIGICTLWLLLS